MTLWGPLLYLDKENLKTVSLALQNFMGQHVSKVESYDGLIFGYHSADDCSILYGTEIFY